MIKVSDYIANYLKSRGLETVFGISGGASLHLLHSFESNGVKLVCPHHEQGAAMAADAHARSGAKLSVAIASSFPSALPSNTIAKSLIILSRKRKKKPMHFALVLLTSFSFLPS